MAKREEEAGEIVATTGLGVDMTLSNPKLEPQFRPIIDKITEVAREATGKACQESVVAKLR